MKKIALPTLLIFFFIAAGCGNGQTINGLTKYRNNNAPVEFAPELSLKGNTYKGSFSDDYNTFYFFRKKAPDVEKYVPYISTFENGHWNTPEVAEYYNEDYSFTYQLKVPGTNKLIFISNMKTKVDTTNRPNYNFWSVEQSNRIYGNPKELGFNKLLYNYNSQPSISKNGTLFFTSDLPDWSHTYSYKMDLIENNYEEPVLFEPVNEWREKKNWSVFEYCMSPNEDYLIVCIQEKTNDGLLDTDLYVSYSEGNRWSEPRKLNSNINTPETENFPVISADGNYLIFTRAFSKFYIIPIKEVLEKEVSFVQNDDVASQEELVLSYIGNMGVLIESEGKTVLIDGLHDKYKRDYLHPTPEMLNSLATGVYKGHNKIEIVCVTHYHKDHFDPVYTQRFLTENVGSIFIGSNQVKKGILQIDPENKETIEQAVRVIRSDNEIYSVRHEGINIKAVQCQHVNPVRHSKVENIAYLVELNGFRILHVGDTNWNEAAQSFVKLGLKNIALDVAILPYWMLLGDSSRESVQGLIAPKKLIATHIPPTFTENERQELYQRFSNISLFEGLEETLIYTRSEN